MGKIFIVVLMTIMSLPLFAQVNKDTIVVKGKYIEKCDTTYQINQVEKTPQYGNIKNFASNFFLKNMRYPAEAKKKGISGRVLLEIIVDKSGNVIRPMVLSQISPEIDAEAIRLVESMGKWTPATLHGASVCCAVKVPVDFKITKNKQ